MLQVLSESGVQSLHQGVFGLGQFLHEEGSLKSFCRIGEYAHKPGHDHENDYHIDTIVPGIVIVHLSPLKEPPS